MSNFTFQNNIFFDMNSASPGGNTATLKSLQRVCNNPPDCTDATVTAIRSNPITNGKTGLYFVGGYVGESGATGSAASFNCAASFHCPLGTNFQVTNWNGVDTLQWKQAGPDSGPWTTLAGNLGPASVDIGGCDYNNTGPSDLLSRCFSPFSFTKNIIYSTSAPTRTWFGTAGVDYFNLSTANVGFTDYAGGKYKLATGSPYHKGTDGKDIGVSDIDKLMQMTGGVDTLQ
jgi:hypothetical protein